MLPITRLIGHKDYGNTPPGGWKGRKGDPVYDMDWRRARVAAFTPRTGTTDDEMEQLMSQLTEAEKVNFRKLLGFVEGTPTAVVDLLIDVALKGPIYAWNDQNNEPTTINVTGGPQTARAVAGGSLQNSAAALASSVATLAAVRELAAQQGVHFDVKELAAEMGPILAAQMELLDDDGLTRLATRLEEIRDARARDGDPTTGPVS